MSVHEEWLQREFRWALHNLSFRCSHKALHSQSSWKPTKRVKTMTILCAWGNVPIQVLWAIQFPYSEYACTWVLKFTHVLSTCHLRWHCVSGNESSCVANGWQCSLCQCRLYSAWIPTKQYCPCHGVGWPIWQPRCSCYCTAQWVFKNKIN